MHYNYGEYSKTLNIDYKCGECSKTLKILSDDHCPPFVYFFVQKKSSSEVTWVKYSLTCVLKELEQVAPTYIQECQMNQNKTLWIKI